MIELKGRAQQLWCLAFSADNRFLAVGGSSCRADLFDLTAPGAKRPLFERLAHSVADVRISADGSEFVVAEFASGDCSWFRRTERDAVRTFQLPDDAEDGAAVPHLLRDGSGLVFGAIPAKWAFTASAEPVWRDPSPRGRRAEAIGPSPDGRYVAVSDFGGASATYPVSVHDTVAGGAARRFAVEGLPVRRFAWSPDGALLAAAVGTRAKVWHAADGTPAGEFVIPGKKHISDLAFHPGGERLALADNAGTVRVLARGPWSEVRAFEWGVPKARCLAFSPDGALAAVGSDTGQVMVWDVDL